MPIAWLKRNLQLTTYNLQMLVVACCLLLVAIPQNTYAIIGIDEPLIPCGTKIETTDGVTQIKNPCTFCHFFALIQNIYNFLIFVIVPPVAVVMIAIGGFFWLTAAGNPGRVQTGHKIILSVLAGLVIMYAAWLVISFGISLIAKDIAIYNPAKWYNPSQWFQISCDYTFGKLYICPSDPDTIIPSKIECERMCSQSCTELTDPGSEGLIFSAGVNEIPLAGSAPMSWSIGKDKDGKDIDHTSCQVIAEGIIQNDPAGIKDQLTNAVRASRSGSTIVNGFKETGMHSYTLVCGSYAKNTSFHVREGCVKAEDFSLHWYNNGGSEISTITVPLTAYATLQYNASECAGKPAAIEIIDQAGTTLVRKEVPSLDTSGAFKVPYQTSQGNCAPVASGPPKGDTLKFFGKVIVGSTPLSKNSNTLSIICSS